MSVSVMSSYALGLVCIADYEGASAVGPIPGFGYFAHLFLGIFDLRQLIFVLRLVQVLRVCPNSQHRSYT